MQERALCVIIHSKEKRSRKMQYERKNIDPKYKWDLSNIFESEEAFYKEYARISSLVKKFASHEKNMTKSADNLLSAVKDITEIELSPSIIVVGGGKGELFLPLAHAQIGAKVAYGVSALVSIEVGGYKRKNFVEVYRAVKEHVCV